MPIADKEAFKTTDRHPHINPYRVYHKPYFPRSRLPSSILERSHGQRERERERERKREKERKSNLPKTRYLVARSPGNRTHAAENRDSPWPVVALMRSNYYRMGHLVCGTDIPRWCTTLVAPVDTEGSKEEPGSERERREEQGSTPFGERTWRTNEREIPIGFVLSFDSTRTSSRAHVRPRNPPRLNIICGPYRSLPPRERRRTSR